MRAWTVGVALAAALLPWASEGRAAPLQVCGNSVEGGVYDTGYYGGGGTSVPCVTSGGVGGGAGYDVMRQVHAEPSLCAGTPDALMETLTYVHNVTGEVMTSISRCLGPDVPADAVPPPPPSPTEVLERLPLPMPQIHTSPPGRGLVGFPTHLWWGAEVDLPAVTVAVGEWTANVTPELLGIEWDMGNGDRVTGDGPGSEEDPSARYTYIRKCDCTITMTVTWGGTVTLSHPLLGAPLVESAAGVPFTTSSPYDVIEREAVVIG